MNNTSTTSINQQIFSNSIQPTSIVQFSVQFTQVMSTVGWILSAVSFGFVVFYIYHIRNSKTREGEDPRIKLALAILATALLMDFSMRPATSIVMNVIMAVINILSGIKFG